MVLWRDLIFPGWRWMTWMTRLSSEILSPPPIFETHREMAEYPKCQTHSVIGLYSNLVEKFNSKNELSIPAEFLYRLWWYHWVAMQSLALNSNIQCMGRRNKYIEAIGDSICSTLQTKGYSLNFTSTEGALRLPTTYDNQSHPHVVLKTTFH